MCGCVGCESQAWPSLVRDKPLVNLSREFIAVKSEGRVSALSWLRRPFKQFAGVRPQFLPGDALVCRQRFQILRLPDRREIWVLEQGFHLPADGRLVRGQDAAHGCQVGGQKLKGLAAVACTPLGRRRIRARLSGAAQGEAGRVVTVVAPRRLGRLRIAPQPLEGGLKRQGVPFLLPQRLPNEK